MGEQTAVRRSTTQVGASRNHVGQARTGDAGCERLVGLVAKVLLPHGRDVVEGVVVLALEGPPAAGTP